MPRVLAHHAGGIARHRLFDLFEPSLDLLLREFHGQCPFGDIEDNHVAVLHGADRAALDGVRCTWPAIGQGTLAEIHAPALNSADCDRYRATMQRDMLSTLHPHA